MKLSRNIIIVIGLIMSTSLFSQHRIGLTQSNYAGINGIMANPASMTSSLHRWDMNLIGLNLNVYSQYGHIADIGYKDLRSKTILDASDSVPKQFDPNANALFYFDRLSSPFTGLLHNLEVMGPLSIAFKAGHSSFGLFSNVRTNITARNIPSFFDYYNLKVIEDSVMHHIEDFSISGIAMGEIGGHFGHKSTLPSGNELSIGINAKYLLGTDAFYIDNKTPFSFMRIGDSLISSNLNVELGVATGMDYTTGKYQPKITGKGASIDFGIEYIVNYESDENEIVDEDDVANTKYKYKFGASIRDLGVINYDQNAEVHKLRIDGSKSIYNELLKDKNKLRDILNESSNALYGNYVTSNVGKDFSMLLPTTLYLSADVNLRKNVFINTQIIRNLRFSSTQLSLPNIIAITPRYESRWFETGTPISLMEEDILAIGFYVRLGFLTIGSEHFGAYFFEQQKLRQGDVYLSLKFNPFWKKRDKDEYTESLGSSGKRKETGCYKKW